MALVMAYLVRDISWAITRFEHRFIKDTIARWVGVCFFGSNGTDIGVIKLFPFSSIMLHCMKITPNAVLYSQLIYTGISSVWSENGSYVMSMKNKAIGT